MSRSAPRHDQIQKAAKQRGPDLAPWADCQFDYMHQKLLLTALRVMVCLANRELPDPMDVEALDRHALPGEPDLPLPTLCCRIVERVLNVPDGLSPKAEDGGEKIKAAEPSIGCTLEENERLHIERVFRATNYNVTKSAKVLDIDRTTLYRKLQKYGLNKAKAVSGFRTLYPKPAPTEQR